MRKSFKYYLAIWAIGFVLFNCLCFLTPSTIEGKSILELIQFIQSLKGSNSIDVATLESYGLNELVFNKYGGSFWIAYISILVAFIGLLVCFYIAFKNTDNQKFFYRIPLLKISYSCLIITLVVGVLCMIIPNLPNWVGMIICFVILLFNIIAVLKASATIETVESIDTKVKEQTSFIKNLTIEAENLISIAKTEESKKACKEVYEAIRYSDPMSNDELKDVEEEIQKQFTDFTNKLNFNENTEKVKNNLLALINKRNNLVKNLK